MKCPHCEYDDYDKEGFYMAIDVADKAVTMEQEISYNDNKYIMGCPNCKKLFMS